MHLHPSWRNTKKCIAILLEAIDQRLKNIDPDEQVGDDARFIVPMRYNKSLVAVNGRLLVTSLELL